MLLKPIPRSELERSDAPGGIGEENLEVVTLYCGLQHEVDVVVATSEGRKAEETACLATKEAPIHTKTPAKSIGQKPM